MSDSLQQININTYIKAGENGQIPLLQALELRAAALFPDEVLPKHLKNQPTSVSTFKTAIATEQCFILTTDDTPLGFCIIGQLEDSLHLHEISIDPQYGRQGLGTQLLAFIIDLAGQRGHPSLTLTTFLDIPWNAPFYINNGFTIISKDGMSASLRDILENERRLGLKNRVGMIRPITSTILENR